MKKKGLDSRLPFSIVVRSYVDVYHDIFFCKCTVPSDELLYRSGEILIRIQLNAQNLLSA